MEAHHTSICVPLNGILVKTSLVIDSLLEETRIAGEDTLAAASLTLRRFALFSCQFCLAGGFS